MTIPVLVIAGVASGVGKTTVMIGLIEALRRRGLTVQAFKVGPDFIDPGFHALVSGRPSVNLDGWMCGRLHARESVARHASDADLALVEGVMGCFDGFDARSEDGSTAQIAKWLGAPVVLVVDAGAMARSAGAVVLGFERFDPALEVAGAIWNRVGGSTHRRWLDESLAGTSGGRSLGALPAGKGIAMAERHLGLVTAVEQGIPRDALGRLIEQHVDLDALISRGRSSVPRRSAAEAAADRGRPRARIGVARDAAFQFYYADNLALLEGAGAQLIWWSPLADRTLPQVDGLYIGGGYPEVHAAALARNEALLEEVRAFSASGRPIYAECGGLMYLARTLEDGEGRAWPMVGLLPGRVRMTGGHLVLGYREILTTGPSLLGRPGLRVRGHEFHASILDPLGEVARTYQVADGQGEPRAAEGYQIGRALMSYVHLHFASAPSVAAAFVQSCEDARGHSTAPAEAGAGRPTARTEQDASASGPLARVQT
jgi:cobyrinic acid a,c-diamide synthase